MLRDASGLPVVPLLPVPVGIAEYFEYVLSYIGLTPALSRSAEPHGDGCGLNSLIAGDPVDQIECKACGVFEFMLRRKSVLTFFRR